MKAETIKFHITHPLRKTAVLSLGLIIMGFGVAFSIKADLGTSPISSVPYVVSRISGLSVGITTILVNTVFILSQIAVLRKQYDPIQLLQFPAVMLFGFMIDIAGVIIEPIPIVNYFEQWALCIAGILLLALGVSVEILANFITTPGEGLVLAICKVTPMKFGNMKVVFDIALVIIAVVVSLLFLKRLDGVREGTVAAAVFVGLSSKMFLRMLKKYNKYFE